MFQEAHRATERLVRCKNARRGEWRGVSLLWKETTQPMRSRRDLEDLRAAIGHHAAEGYHREIVRATLFCQNISDRVEKVPNFRVRQGRPPFWISLALKVSICFPSGCLSAWSPRWGLMGCFMPPSRKRAASIFHHSETAVSAIAELKPDI